MSERVGCQPVRCCVRSLSSTGPLAVSLMIFAPIAVAQQRQRQHKPQRLDIMPHGLSQRAPSQPRPQQQTATSRTLKIRPSHATVLKLDRPARRGYCWQRRNRGCNSSGQSLVITAKKEAGSTNVICLDEDNNEFLNLLINVTPGRESDRVTVHISPKILQNYELIFTVRPMVSFASVSTIKWDGLPNFMIPVLRKTISQIKQTSRRRLVTNKTSIIARSGLCTCWLFASGIGRARPS